jgi:endonuclease G
VSDTTPPATSGARANRLLARSIVRDPALVEEFMDTHGGRLGNIVDGSAESPGAFEDSLATAMATHSGLEAIVERFGRPSLLVIGDTFELPESQEWRNRLRDTRAAIESGVLGVGRVDIRFHALPYAGTAWLVADDIAVTNRHVAKAFAHRRNGLFPFSTGAHGMTYEAFIDFAAEPGGSRSVPIEIPEVLYIADDGDGYPDLAFLRLETGAQEPRSQFIHLSERTLGADDFVVAIGYPARDSRQDPADQDRIFGDVYNVKRIAPGRVTAGGQTTIFNHDCTTLGGNSGSLVLDPVTGDAVGLHFAGRREVANYAVGAAVVREYLERYVTGAGMPKVRGRTLAQSDEEAPATAEDLADRSGYDPAFLGEGFRVPLPTDPNDRALIVDDETGTELRYTHYSVVMHRERRLALVSAVNIDGASLHPIKRGTDRWYFDPRIPKDAQIGNELYAANPLDRGHLVRRLDPAWGDSRKEALAGEEDSFYYSNSCPQHLSLNRSTWLALEDYVLQNAETFGFRACVLSGPVLTEDDPDYRGLTSLPQAFWKVAVMVREPDGDVPDSLVAAGYMLGQADLISDLEFSFGEFRTYQVPISRIAELTELEFDPEIVEADPLAGQESVSRAVTIDGPDDLIL